MLFEETLKDTVVIKPEEIKPYTLHTLEPEREYNIRRIKKACLKKWKKIPNSKVIKLAIDNLVNDLEDLTEEEAIEYMRELYKDAEF